MILSVFERAGVSQTLSEGFVYDEDEREEVLERISEIQELYDAYETLKYELGKFERELGRDLDLTKRDFELLPVMGLRAARRGITEELTRNIGYSFPYILSKRRRLKNTWPQITIGVLSHVSRQCRG